MMECAFVWSTPLPDFVINTTFEPLQQTSFAVFQRLFGAARDAISLLVDGPAKGKGKGTTKLVLEFVCSELYTGLPKLIEGDIGPRPESYPKKYLRMWLSNTPYALILYFCSMAVTHAMLPIVIIPDP